MSKQKHKVFICYHHRNDQVYKDALLAMNDQYDIFIDASVDTGDISDSLGDEAIRQKIRDDYLRDSTVTIVLVGLETKNRKHVDWEIYSSMFDGKVNKQSGVLVINLPSTHPQYFTASHGDPEKRLIYPENTLWTTITSRAEYERRYPYAPARIIDNLESGQAKISVTNWEKIADNPENLRFLIDATSNDRAGCHYDLHRPMRRADS